MTLYVAIKPQATGSETSLTFSTSGSASIIGAVASFSGGDNVTPEDVTNASDQISTNTTATPTVSITPVTSESLIVAINAADSPSGDVTFTFTTSAGTTEAWVQRTDQANGFYNASMATALQSTAGALTVTCTRNVSSGNAMKVIALRSGVYVPPPSGGAFDDRYRFRRSARMGYTSTAIGQRMGAWPEDAFLTSPQDAIDDFASRLF